MDKKARVLLVEDTESLAAIYQQYLKDEPLSVSHVTTIKDAKLSIDRSPPDIILLDLQLPDGKGNVILDWIQERKFPSAVIVITAHSSVNVAIEVMQAGAYDFIEKPFNAKRLQTTIRNTYEKYQLKNLVEEFKSNFARTSYHGFIGDSLPMQAVYKTIDAAAPSKASIFITGESGTGKEVCAEAIHKQGPRKHKAFVALNCAAIPKDLIESEIFGHLKGAFTGAAAERKGAAEMADGGTLFLDEIGELDIDLQSKLLRFVQTGSFQKVGSSQTQTVDVRFVSATNRNPLEEVREGRFREDLYYRLHVVPIHLPSLKERGADIITIAQSFLLNYAKEENKNFKSFCPEVEVILSQYDWPGNIRQLQNVIRNIIVLHNDDVVKPSHLPPPLDNNSIASSAKTSEIMNSQGQSENITADLIHNEKNEVNSNNTSSEKNTLIRPLALVEKETIETAISQCQGNIPKAAALLEVSPSTIYRKKQSWEEQGLV